MPRRREVPKREILPDPKFGNVELSKFMNVIMEGGKKAVAFGDFATTWHFLPLSCFSWHRFRHRESHSGLPLTRPAQDICVWGHYAGLPRHAENSTE